MEKNVAYSHGCGTAAQYLAMRQHLAFVSRARPRSAEPRPDPTFPKKRQPRNPGSDLDIDHAWRMQGSPDDFRNRSRPSRVMPHVLGALPVRSAARLACPTATSTNSARLNRRRRSDVVLMPYDRSAGRKEAVVFPSPSVKKMEKCLPHSRAPIPRKVLAAKAEYLGTVIMTG
jgi:hypothetical protein